MPDNLSGGSFEYQLRADNLALTKALDEAKAKLAELEARANRTDESLGKLGSGMKSVEKSVGDSTKVLTKFVGMFGAIAGVAAGAFALGRSIREGIGEALESGTEKAKKFLDALDMTKPQEALQSTRKEISELEAKLSQSLEGGHGLIGRYLFGESNPDKLKEQLAELRKTAQSLQNQQNAQARDKERKEEEKRIDDLQKARDDAFSAAHEGAEKIEFDSQRRIAALKKQLDSERNETARRLLEETITWEDQARRLKLVDLEEEKRKKAQEAADKLRADEEEKDRKLADQRNDLARQLLDEEEQIRFDATRAIAELEIQLDKERSEERKRLLREEIEMWGELMQKKLGELMAKTFSELQRMKEQLESGNNNVVFSLGAIIARMDSIVTRLG